MLIVNRALQFKFEMSICDIHKWKLVYLYMSWHWMQKAKLKLRGEFEEIIIGTRNDQTKSNQLSFYSHGQRGKEEKKIQEMLV